MSGAYISIIQGDTYVFSTNINVDAVSQNIAEASLWFLAKVDPESDDDAQARINASTASGQIVISGNNSDIVTMTLNSNVTANYQLSPSLHWALKVITAGGNAYTVDRGRAAITITPIRATS
jgi:hypothetical protein